MVGEERGTLAGKDAFGNQRYRLDDFTVLWDGTRFAPPHEMFGYTGLGDGMYTRIESISCTSRGSATSWLTKEGGQRLITLIRTSSRQD